MFTYNQNNQILSRTDYNGYNLKDFWIEDRKTLYNYNPDGSQDQILGQYWDNGTWKNNSKVEYQYIATDISNDFIEEFTINIFPNPANDYIDINMERRTPLSNWSLSQESDEIRIYNVMGECVKKHNPDIIYTPKPYIHTPTNPNIHTPSPSQEGNLEGVRIDVSDLTAGVYFIRVGSFVARIVILR